MKCPSCSHDDNRHVGGQCYGPRTTLMQALEMRMYETLIQPSPIWAAINDEPPPGRVEAFPRVPDGLGGLEMIVGCFCRWSYLQNDIAQGFVPNIYISWEETMYRHPEDAWWEA
jgi:hypothetical protein